jgi:peptidyl-prolyl cis-trans isomerase SurA
VTTQDFYARHTAARAPIAPLDQPGIIPLPDSHAQAPSIPEESRPGNAFSPVTAGDLPPNTAPSIPPVLATQPSSSIQPVASTQPAGAATQSASAAGTTTQPASFAEDQYMTVGSVVLTVNGRPIYANKVLRLDIDIFREKARELDRARFEIFARTQIERTVEQLTEDELEVAAAERTLDPKDLQLAQALTHLWVQNQIAEAGGSEQVVRLRAHATGEDFEDVEQDQYRSYLQQLYYYKKIFPRIDYTAEDERRYYHAHIDEFTTVAQASIILIESDPAKYNGDEKIARAKLQDIRKRTLAGEDFADYARNRNDLPGSEGDQGNGGQMTLKPNTFVLSNVEAAVWKTPAGQISDVIQDHDAFYLFKVISKDDGGTKPFSDRTVQQAIKKKLDNIQFQARRQAEYRKLIEDKIATPENIDPVLDMAMQNYARWTRQDHRAPT